MPCSVFLSYVREEDDAFARQLAADLRAHGLEIRISRFNVFDRGRPFGRQTREAIDARDRLILIVGPQTRASEIVTAEWRYALASGKAITPVLKEGDLRNVPLQLRLLSVFDFRHEAGREQALASLVRQLGEAAPTVGTLVGVPSLPPHYRERLDCLRTLKTAAMADLARQERILGPAYRADSHETNGVGESALAGALAHEVKVRQAFPDGIFRLPLGERPALIELQRWLARQVGESGAFGTVAEGRFVLGQILADKRALLVLDDVRQAAHAQAFDVFGPRCRGILVTRNASLGTPVGGIAHQVQLLAEAESLDLLARRALKNVQDVPPFAREAAHHCGGLPLALGLCGGMVRHGLPWRELHEGLKNGAPEFETHPHRRVLTCVRLAYDRLSPMEQRRFLELIIFPPGVPVPAEVGVTLWSHTGGMPEEAAGALLHGLGQAGLVRLEAAFSQECEEGRRWFSLPQLVHAFAAARAKDPAELHTGLLDAYARVCPEGWHMVPDDGYFFEHLAYHLVQAGREQELRSLLLDYRWLRAKLVASGPLELLQDFEGLRQDDDVLKAVQRTLRLSAHLLTKDPDQLASQLHGRLLGRQEPRIKALLTQAAELAQRPRLLPRGASFTAPGGPLVQTLDGHRDIVSAVAVTADGDRVVSASDDGTLKVWDLASGEERQHLKGHTDRVVTVAVTPDGMWALSGSWDNTLKVWDLATGECVRTLEGHTDWVTSVALAPEGAQAVSASNDGTLRIWDIASNLLEPYQFQARYTLDIPVSRIFGVTHVAVKPGGNWAVSASGDGTVNLWDLVKGEVAQSFNSFIPPGTVPAMTPDGSRVVYGARSRILKVWDVATGRVVRQLEGHMDISKMVALTPDGGRIVCASADGTVMAWEVETGRTFAAFRLQAKGVTAVAVTPDASQAVCASSDGTLRTCDLMTVDAHRLLRGHESAVSAVAVTPDGARAVSASPDNTLKVWDLATGECVRTLEGHGCPVMGVAVTRDSSQAVSVSTDAALVVWDLATGEMLRRSRYSESELTSLTAVGFTPHGEYAVGAVHDYTRKAHVVGVWDVATGRVVRTLEGHARRVGAVAVTADGTRAISASEVTLKVWDLIRGEALPRPSVPIFGVANVLVTPDGDRAVSASDDGTLKVWDLATGKCVRILEGHTDWVTSVALAPDGSRVVSGSWDNTLKVWDLATGECVRTLEGHTDGVNAVEMMTEGGRAVSLSWDKTLKVWDLARGGVVATFCGESRMTACASSSNGCTIVAGEASGRVHVLRLIVPEHGSGA